MKPEMIFGLWVEAEAVTYFEAHYTFHASTSKLANHPDFCAIDLFFEITDHTFPWWKKAHDDPESCFPNTWRFVKEKMEDKGFVEMAQMKQDQLKHGIQGAYDEITKIYSNFIKTPWVFTVIICPKRGPVIFQVLLELAKDIGLD